VALIPKYLPKFINLLEEKDIDVVITKQVMICSSGKNKLSFSIDEQYTTFPIDFIVSAPEKIAAVIQSKLSLNKKVFARNCEEKKIDKNTATNFLDKYHLLKSTQSGSNYGLYLKNELLAVASFSKGRKMNRLQTHERSFELIRFCCKEGITVTGGLTKLVKNFCKDKKAGDVMTYIDKQFSSGESFIKAGFVKHSETLPHYFLVNRKTFERINLKTGKERFDEKLFYLSHNSGNVKLVYTPNE